MPPKLGKKEIAQPSISSFFKPTSNAVASSSSSRITNSNTKPVERPPKRQKIIGSAGLGTNPIDVDVESTDEDGVEMPERSPGTLSATLEAPMVAASVTSTEQGRRSEIPSSRDTRLLQYRAPEASEWDSNQHGTDIEADLVIRNGRDVAILEGYAFPGVDEQTERNRRHERWQKRLGQGLIAPRRNSLPLDQAEEGHVEGDDADFEMLEDDADVLDMVNAGTSRNKPQAKTSKGTKTNGKAKRKEEVGPSGMTYTPLEKQFMEIKEANPDVLLLMEVGYKFKFHGDDAKVASKELGIACFPMRNFYSASIPVHRLHIHVKKLIARGHKVGVIRQTETAALKAVGDNRNKPFERKMTNLYTAATYVDDSSLNDDDMLTDPARSTNAFVCITESKAGGNGTDEHVQISLLGIVIGTGDVTYDDFRDSHLRNELETRLTHLSPTEILLPERPLSKSTERAVASWIDRSESHTGTGTRLERRPFPESRDKALKAVASFYRISQDDTECVDLLSDYEDRPMSDADARISRLEQLPEGISLCTAAAIQHLKRFNLANALLHVDAFTEFTTRSTMLLSANTLQNLEIFRNQTDFGSKGSLLWLLDHTKTKMGKRLLKEWIGRPLVDAILLEERLGAVAEIKNDDSLTLEKLKGLLKGSIPDLGRGLSRIQYERAEPGEVATILIAFGRLGDEFEEDIPTGLPQNPLLARIVRSFPKVKEPIKRLLSDIDIRKARTDKPEDMFKKADLYPRIALARKVIAESEALLDSHLQDIRRDMKMGTLQYVTVAGIEHLIEFRLKHVVPDNWIKVSSTKHVARYHTPFVVAQLKELEQGKETLVEAGKRAFLHWQVQISQHYDVLRYATLSFATLDCLMALAKVGSGSDYCRPSFVHEGRLLDLHDVRHPMSEALMDDYVANSFKFSEDTTSICILTGPNMAGKTSFTRAVALCLVMAQVGSYVPCSKAKLSVHDAIWSRMGASDDLARNRSTFMVELKETSDILAGATKSSFVVLDELGRGTSTMDGTAIAWAVLDRLVKQGCNTIFTTHFPALAKISEHYPREVSVNHMGFSQVEGLDGQPEIVFLYKLLPSLSNRSFGTYVGRLAGLPTKLLDRADRQSEWMRKKVKDRWASKLAQKVFVDSDAQTVDIVEALHVAKASRLQ